MRLPWRIKAFLCFLLFSIAFTGAASGTDVHVWPGYVTDECWTTGERKRLKMLGPVVEERWECDGGWGALRPFWVSNYDCKRRTKGTHVLYPMLNYRQTPESTHWNIFNLIKSDTFCEYGKPRDWKMMVFPFYISRQTGDPCTSYEGLFPLGGNIRHFLGNDKIGWAWFPLYLVQERDCVSRHSLPWPFIRWQTGYDAGGYALWPFIGHFWKHGKYDHQYGLWPFIYRYIDYDEDECEPRIRQGFLPFYAFECSAKKNTKSVLWPFYTHTEMKDPDYVENQFPWPFFVQGRGERQYVNRWAPIYTHSIRNGVDKKWYFWPLFRVKQWKEKGVAIDNQQFLYILIQRQRQRSLTNPSAPIAEKSHVWPLYSYWDNGAGRKQFQFLSPLSVMFPMNDTIKKVYSPLFAIYRYDQENYGCRRHSILFDLIRVEKDGTGGMFRLGPLFKIQDRSGCVEMELFCGLIRVKRKDGKHSVRLFWT